MVKLKPVVALVGRPNVGKSAIFNRLVGDRVAVVEDTPGVTRDRIYGEVEWAGVEFVLIDTGGIVDRVDDDIIGQVKSQAVFAIDEADVIILTLDGQSGISEEDKDVANILRAANKPVIMAVNKSESEKKADHYEFYPLGFGDPIPVSALHGTNMGDLLDQVIDSFSERNDIADDMEDAIKISVVGKPNVGKSSLVNAVLQENRIVVNDEPGTTRDAVDTVIWHGQEKYVFTDTAGLRKKSKVKAGIEKYSTLRSIKAIERSEISILVIDALEGVTEQDKKIADLVTDRGNALIIAINKWDLVDKEDRSGDKFLKYVKYELSFVDFAPILFISAVTGKNLNKLFGLIGKVALEHCKRIPTPDLNKVIDHGTLTYPPPSEKGRRLKIYYATQTKVKPPTFLLFVNDKNLLKQTYKKYLIGRLREAYDFEGTPVHLKVKPKEK